MHNAMPSDECPAVSQRGFTLVELIMVMVIIGILAAVAAPRFFDANVFQTRGFADEVQATLRYAQKQAIAQRRTVCVVFDTVTTPNSITLNIDNNNPPDGFCNVALPMPTGLPVNAPTGVAFGAVSPPQNFDFSALGRPTQPASATVGTTTISVEAETGYVHQ